MNNNQNQGKLDKSQYKEKLDEIRLENELKISKGGKILKKYDGLIRETIKETIDEKLLGDGFFSGLNKYYGFRKFFNLFRNKQEEKLIELKVKLRKDEKICIEDKIIKKLEKQGNLKKIYELKNIQDDRDFTDFSDHLSEFVINQVKEKIEKQIEKRINYLDEEKKNIFQGLNNIIEGKEIKNNKIGGQNNMKNINFKFNSWAYPLLKNRKY